MLAGESAADEVEDLLRTGDCRIAAPNLAEAVDVCGRVHSLAVDRIRETIAPLVLSGVLSVAVSGEAEAWLAAELRIEHYHRSGCPLSMADCFLLAHAVSSGGALATADPDLARVARAEAVSLIALPDRSGNRP